MQVLTLQWDDFKQPRMPSERMWLSLDGNLPVDLGIKDSRLAIQEVQTVGPISRPGRLAVGDKTDAPRNTVSCLVPTGFSSRLFSSLSSTLTFCIGLGITLSFSFYYLHTPGKLPFVSWTPFIVVRCRYSALTADVLFFSDSRVPVVLYSRSSLSLSLTPIVDIPSGLDQQQYSTSRKLSHTLPIIHDVPLLRKKKHFLSSSGTGRLCGNGTGGSLGYLNSRL